VTVSAVPPSPVLVFLVLPPGPAAKSPVHPSLSCRTSLSAIHGDATLGHTFLGANFFRPVTPLRPWTPTQSPLPGWDFFPGRTFEISDLIGNVFFKHLHMFLEQMALSSPFPSEKFLFLSAPFMVFNMTICHLFDQSRPRTPCHHLSFSQAGVGHQIGAPLGNFRRCFLIPFPICTFFRRDMIPSQLGPDPTGPFCVRNFFVHSKPLGTLPD